MFPSPFRRLAPQYAFLSSFLLQTAFYGVFSGLTVSVSAQVPAVTALTSTPAVNTGHDYLGSLNEIVDPATGSLSIRIAAR